MSYSVLLLGGASLDLAAAALTDEFKIDVCRLAQQAFERMKERKPDLIVLDNSMPGKTGLEVARELKTLIPDTAIVFLTLDPGIRDLAIAVGAVGHISKDTPPQEMLKVLRDN